MKQETKKVYTTPRVTVHGDAAKLTQETTSGSKYDRVFNTALPGGVNNPILMS